MNQEKKMSLGPRNLESHPRREMKSRKRLEGFEKKKKTGRIWTVFGSRRGESDEGWKKEWGDIYSIFGT